MKAEMQDLPTFEMQPVRRGSIRARIIVSFGALAVFCVAMAYVTGHSPQESCKPVYWEMQCGPDGHYYSGYIGPNLIWFFFAAWPAAVSVITAFASWVATGRPW